MNPLKAFIRRLPGGKALTDRLSYNRRRRKLEEIGGTEERFTNIFEKNKWKDAESRSGAGSSMDATSLIRESIPELVEELGVTRFLDAPCGDYHWFRAVRRGPDVKYIGGDIVKALIASNEQSYADERTEFIYLNIIKDPLPAADLWLCRDCLIHLSYDDIDKVLANFLNSDIKYLLATTHGEVRENIDIPTGHCRMINLELEPFRFSAPIRYLDDNDHDGTGKRLGLWERESLAAALGR